MPARGFREMGRSASHGSSKILGQQGRHLVGADETRSIELAAFAIVEPGIEPVAPRIDGDGEGFATLDRSAPQRYSRHYGDRVGSLEFRACDDGKAACSGDGDAHPGKASRSQGRSDEV